MSKYVNKFKKINAGGWVREMFIYLFENPVLSAPCSSPPPSVTDRGRTHQRSNFRSGAEGHDGTCSTCVVPYK